MPIHGPPGLYDPHSKHFEAGVEADGSVGALDTPSVDARAPGAPTAAFDVEIAALRAIDSVVAYLEPHVKGHCHAAEQRQ